jgi:hypothetical protein
MRYKNREDVEIGMVGRIGIRYVLSTSEREIAREKQIQSEYTEQQPEYIEEKREEREEKRKKLDLSEEIKKIAKRQQEGNIRYRKPRQIQARGE